VPAVLTATFHNERRCSASCDQHGPTDGVPRRTVHHMLKMFLIDRTGVIREIYTLAFLQPTVIVNDIRTLYLEERTSAAVP
jgi:hypothetical protein